MLEEYIQDLKSHDWTFEYSDSGSTWRNGSQELHRLEQRQKLIDVDYKIWNQHCPEQFKRNQEGTQK